MSSEELGERGKRLQKVVQSVGNMEGDTTVEVVMETFPQRLYKQTHLSLPH